MKKFISTLCLTLSPEGWDASSTGSALVKLKDPRNLIVTQTLLDGTTAATCEVTK